MNQLPVSLYGQRVWYKLPYEGFHERKSISNGDANFNKMCMAAKWTKAVDIFVEADGDGNANRVEENDNREEVASDEEARPECVQFEEEIRVERNVATAVDVDDEYDEYATPVESDAEDEYDDGYVRYIKGSGELKFLQVFDSIEAFKNAIVEYVLNSGKNIKYVRWEKAKSELRCASGCAHGGKETEEMNPEALNPDIEGENPETAVGSEPRKEVGQQEDVEEAQPCQWRIYCAYETTVQKYVVKTFNDDHSCMNTGYSKIITQEVIARLFVNDVRDNPNIMPKNIREEIQKRWGLIASGDQCRKAKARALEMIQEEHDEQYSRLKDYRLELLE
ncbi:uncharacterized protein LOC110226135 [Arabidopsis lyrata subsp. lyrata]|uniref:uncharacterized protein LOC110226135 n=1 Tax=Arabidopsis lyrata subsp. lyrata TaxID=81972 RepID=UPI000A29C2F1|nr:uncharacterized protein LOC110226135 [Arabidopsis lyrata subsp. lyrata]|eukprot:XP_020872445.1 uncharacterized protein LOC110226135 [Arabidopsis lyrata subsp. lyrata]